MKARLFTCVELPASEIAVGHCVNVSYVEQPCSKLVAVITQIEGEFAYCKYLNSEPALDSYSEMNQGRGLRNRLESLTPIGDFGVQVFYEDNKKKPTFWCERTSDSVATYSDGGRRFWQEGESYIFPARRELAKFSLNSKREDENEADTLSSDPINELAGPVYGIHLLTHLMLDNGMSQAMPSRSELERVRKVSERTVAAFEVLTHYCQSSKQRIHQMEEAIRSVIDGSCTVTQLQEVLGDLK
jgi:hypothetical protein